MEKQMTIFDVFEDMDRKREGKTIYADCLDEDYFFDPTNGNRLGDMYVVCMHTKQKLFIVTIKLNDQGLIRFNYSAIDGYWQGGHVTSHIINVKKSIRSLVDAERKDRKIDINKPLELGG